MDIGELRDSFGSCTQEEIVAGCNRIRPAIQDWDAAQIWLWKIIRGLLDTNRYRAAARLLWGLELFDPRPKSVATILNAIEANAKTIILGAASQGKSYSIICWLFLDWLRDPEYTATRIISTTGAHALQNTFSSLQRFHDEAILEMPGVAQHGYVGLSTKDRHASLSVIAIKEGDSGRQTLQGLHPIRRTVAHPVFGSLSRVRVFLDEVELVPTSVFRGVSNITSNIHGKETVKIIAACNPWDVTSVAAANAEPEKGWNHCDPDRDFEWRSTSGYQVVRTDAAYSENVLEKRQVYPGLMSYEGYESKRAKGGADYWCYARGFYPMEGTVDQVVPLSFLDGWIGTWIFTSGSVGIAGVDLAFEGDDLVVFCAGRYGLASAFRPAGQKDIIRLSEPRHVVQIDQFVQLPKLKTEGQFEQIKATADSFGISYEYLAIDKTGAGKGVADLFYERGYRNILAIGWGQGSTHTKILQEDRTFCDETMDGITTELMFCLRSYLEFQYILCSPAVDQSRLTKEIIGRRRQRSHLGPTGEVMYKLEDKKAFRGRYGHSCDFLDAMIMALHVARMKGQGRASMEKRSTPVSARAYEEDPTNVTYLDFSKEDYASM